MHFIGFRMQWKQVECVCCRVGLTTGHAVHKREVAMKPRIACLPLRYFSRSKCPLTGSCKECHTYHDCMCSTTMAAKFRIQKFDCPLNVRSNRC